MPASAYSPAMTHKQVCHSPSLSGGGGVLGTGCPCVAQASDFFNEAFFLNPVHGLFIDLTEESYEKQKGEFTRHTLIERTLPVLLLWFSHRTPTPGVSLLFLLSQVILPLTCPHRAIAISMR